MLSVIAISLAACSSSTESTTTSTDSTSQSSPTSNKAANTVVPGVSNISEIKFITDVKNTPGFFDSINGSTATTIKVPPATPVNAGGWAILAGEDKPADQVIITYGENNTVAAVAPVNSQRSDVAKALNNPAYTNSGWNATINTSTLPDGKVVIKAWAYNSNSKEATLLKPTHEVMVSKQ